MSPGCETVGVVEVVAGVVFPVVVVFVLAFFPVALLQSARVGLADGLVVCDPVVGDW